MDGIKQSLICLGAGKSQLPLIVMAKDMGYVVIGIDKNRKAPGFALIDEPIFLSTYSSTEVITALLQLEDKYRFVGILARASGPALFTSAAITERFNLPGLTQKLASIAIEKSKLREFCSQIGIKMPEGKKLKFTGDLSQEIPLPAVVKPDLPLVGKQDVRVVYNMADLQNALKAACHSSANHYAEVEEYVEGSDVTFLFLMQNGQMQPIAFWDELVGVKENGNITGLGVSVPSVILGTKIQEKLANTSELLASIFPEIQALIILSFRVTVSGDVHLIELHADLGGDMIADVLLPKANPENDFFHTALKVATNQRIEISEQSFRPTSLLYDWHQYPGKMISSFDKIGPHFFISSNSLEDNQLTQNLLFDTLNLHKSPRHNELANANTYAR